MKSGGWLLLAAALAAGGCAVPGEVPVAKPAEAAPPARGPVTLRNPGFELDTPPGAHCAPGWSCIMFRDPKSFRFFADDAGGSNGRRSFCVEPVTKGPWALVTQGVPDKSLHGARVRFSIAMRLSDVAGEGAGPWAEVHRSGVPKRTFKKLVKVADEWQTHSVEFDVPADTRTLSVGATLRGTGRACFDDARLEILEPAKNPV